MPLLTELIDQEILIVPQFTLDCGATLKQVPVAYKTWGKLNETRDNVMIICHAFTGSADVEDWWGPMMGRGKAFDPRRFFIFCANTLGSPYGSASPITVNPDTGRTYGPEFPPTSIRDDVRLHKLVLDHLGITSVAVVIGGSMGGMAVLEWPLCTPQGYVRHVIPLATSARHSAWCISWGEAQRQSIYSDPGYQDGFYENQPASGLAAARMSALLTYRSRDSFESRFGRKPQLQVEKQRSETAANGVFTPPESPKAGEIDDAVVFHNDGLKNAKPRTTIMTSSISQDSSGDSTGPSSSPVSTTLSIPTTRPQIFSAQSYLRYQGDKFIARFDANCYIHITRKLDTHDIARDRIPREVADSEALKQILSTLPPHALVISIATDGLFTPSEQREIAENIPGAELVTVPSPDGHDGFLLEFEVINGHILGFLKRMFPDYYVSGDDVEDEPEEGFSIKKTSVFGEAEVDITRW
ncbi:homoserine O-acetyltransferase [Macrolepiota fuliginosa MF-IS2]|uniref:Homoserine O-acetyltransferase n=1 Tax=Macrolepiota fuliginosa MF-IS2 TaxID=1400762 RepID=A0A9P5XBV0_9AGAR|nr:homoserine O-acetyltransferase [Macrolepiota fuliginosa MF-IS2]